ncbi:tryptophan--tRNA ligase [Legionella taurinensis]|uniref:Tryptophan--tRNA ligase n=1 Tax=Legionella taurinensis TaxID=70611 RepID=A0A3A5L2B6_9GAMM|nr:tryptophan--tRNA ligase [Legionella taurinensis]MDX1838557.1 tryptophan--tRNA ligase [Legionella taurinensis]PUT39003.1 tryptophan--tRNA ligase [Legionella taurinensis]PUT41090.1 tryptophan--tRNA ligase [Legionella taurinensis]PUT43465.1 tryptophan--tRNA ligase [Legionella taurinensis]PUT46482.1 tryptophan--tRNA ligase [Legionella taurinensis]
MKKVILTGDRPTGPLHLGHYIGSLANRVKLQESYEQFVMIADVQALTDNFENPAKIIENLHEVALDYLAVGIEPQKSTLFIQSQIPELAELTQYFLNLVTLGRLERNPTVKTEIQQKGFDSSIPAGFFCYPVSQAADIAAFKAEAVPVGDDQVPMIEQTNEIIRKFNRIYQTDCLKETTAVLSKTSRLVGIDGQAKASKSLGNTIFLSDSPEEIKRKVFLMFTDPNHLKISDPGQVEGNVVFAYLDAFHPDTEEVAALKAHYQKGGLGDSTIKTLLNTTLQTLLEPIRERRSRFNKNEVMDMLITGTAAARQVAQQTMEEVRNAIGLNYFTR